MDISAGDYHAIICTLKLAYKTNLESFVPVAEIGIMTILALFEKENSGNFDLMNAAMNDRIIAILRAVNSSTLSISTGKVVLFFST